MNKFVMININNTRSFRIVPKAMDTRRNILTKMLLVGGRVSVKNFANISEKIKLPSIESISMDSYVEKRQDILDKLSTIQNVVTPNSLYINIVLSYIQMIYSIMIHSFVLGIYEGIHIEKLENDIHLTFKKWDKNIETIDDSKLLENVYSSVLILKQDIEKYHIIFNEYESIKI